MSYSDKTSHHLSPTAMHDCPLSDIKLRCSPLLTLPMGATSSQDPPTTTFESGMPRLALQLVGAPVAQPPSVAPCLRRSYVIHPSSLSSSSVCHLRRHCLPPRKKSDIPNAAAARPARWCCHPSVVTVTCHPATPQLSTPCCHLSAALSSPVNRLPTPPTRRAAPAICEILPTLPLPAPLIHCT